MRVGSIHCRGTLQAWKKTTFEGLESFEKPGPEQPE